jgi:inward rectifier potassium channel
MKRDRSENQDLGFGSRISQESRRRLLNRDGTFNVERKRLPFLDSLSPYHTLLTINWTRFYVLVLSGYFLFNVVFASAYYSCGPGSLAGADERTEKARFLDDFFFSVQTSTTIGYGRIAPLSTAANILASVEALTGLLGFALATSLMFARFSKPDARVLYSNHAIVAPYRGMNGLMFRIANQRNNQLIQVEVQVLLSRFERKRGESFRRFHRLSLERDEVTFFPLTWTVVHPIDGESPLHGQTEEEFRAAESEILVLISATDETFSQTVNSRSSYKADEVVWGAKFSDVFGTRPDGTIVVDLHRLHEYDRVPLADIPRVPPVP